ncbi:hypothetical protein [Massilia glaciei]|uniref:Thioredoxin domain-containing protein n=1 Tax=Massilia glaciei TaxID=1524097 RepID=A0A2U2HKF8_9BURK|nr:hypothetical protein [Massilia glaciei]PWF47991.1 hypothetical protein C7C56_012960 [Massilia glaciei]
MKRVASGFATGFATGLANFLCALALLAAGPASAAPAGIRQFDADSLGTLLATQKGQPFVLVLWSLDCPFCEASLRTLSKKMRADKNLRVVTLGTDTLSDPRNATLMEQRLAALGLAANAWALGAQPAEQLRYAVDRQWHGELPRSYWFGADGVGAAKSGLISARAVDRFLSRRH